MRRIAPRHATRVFGMLANAPLTFVVSVWVAMFTD